MSNNMYVWLTSPILGNEYHLPPLGLGDWPRIGKYKILMYRTFMQKYYILELLLLFAEHYCLSMFSVCNARISEWLSEAAAAPQML